jgi:hypothetical protein
MSGCVDRLEQGSGEDVVHERVFGYRPVRTGQRGKANELEAQLRRAHSGLGALVRESAGDSAMHAHAGQPPDHRV